MFAIYSFAKLWVPAGTKDNHAAVGRFRFLTAWGEELGMSADISEYFLWILGFLGRVFKSIFFLGMKMYLKKLGRNGSLPIH